jgi:hypothetical protein
MQASDEGSQRLELHRKQRVIGEALDNPIGDTAATDAGGIARGVAGLMVEGGEIKPDDA